MSILVMFVAMLGMVLFIALIAAAFVGTFCAAEKVRWCYGESAMLVFVIVALAAILTMTVLLLNFPTILQI